jgi:hypothetical protein
MALSDYRPVWDFRRNRYGKWIDRLAGVHGVYVIREPAIGEVPVTLYVGESHTGRLRDTLQRHFQVWNGKTAGPTFDRLGVEVAVEIFVDPDEAVSRQNTLIRALKPIYNRQIPTPEKSYDGGDYSEDFDRSNFDELADFFDGLAAAR